MRHEITMNNSTTPQPQIIFPSLHTTWRKCIASAKISQDRSIHNFHPPARNRFPSSRVPASKFLVDVGWREPGAITSLTNISFTHLANTSLMFAALIIHLRALSPRGDLGLRSRPHGAHGGGADERRDVSRRSRRRGRCRGRRRSRRHGGWERLSISRQWRLKVSSLTLRLQP